MMMNEALSRHLLKVVALIAVLGLAACSEKADIQTPPSDPNGGSIGTGDDSGDDTGEIDEPTIGDFDLCKSLEGEDDLGDWDHYIEELCDGGKLKTLRSSSVVYTGGSEAKVKVGSEASNGNEVSFRLFTSSIVPTSADKYWDMMKLQFFEPSKFDENFDRDADLDTYKILNDTSSSVEYHYVNTKEQASPVDYEANSRFITLNKGQAYVVATALTKSNETMKDLTALIIINSKTSKSTEVFVVSDQTYDKGDQDKEVAKKSATESLEDEQIRAFKNAEKADGYFD